MIPLSGNRFDDFFVDDAYVLLKNHLYNYLLRKRAINRSLQKQSRGLILEVGSGLSPMVTPSNAVVYSELSFLALRTLKKSCTGGIFVAADATHLPFKAGSFSQVVCSEVLEHLPGDRQALKEITCAMETGGSLILTFPHRRGYFTRDDRFVNHFRRYDLSDMEERLREAGLNAVKIQKVLGPIEKLTMVIVTATVSISQRLGKGKKVYGGSKWLWPVIVVIFKWMNRLLCLLMWIDGAVAPRCLSTVILIRAVKLQTATKSETEYRVDQPKGASLPIP